MPLICSRADVLILKSRINSVYPGGLQAFLQDWPTRAEDDDLVRLHPIRSIGSCGIQLRLRNRGLRPGRDYAVTDAKGRPEVLTDGIIFERTHDIADTSYSWRARAGHGDRNVVSFPRQPGLDIVLARGRDCAPNIVLRDRRDGDGKLDLSVCVNPEGRLVFQRDEACDQAAGSARLSRTWSCRVVQPEAVPQVLVELMAERFKCENSFAEWLRENGIESELMRGGA